MLILVWWITTLLCVRFLIATTTDRHCLIITQWLQYRQDTRRQHRQADDTVTLFLWFRLDGTVEKRLLILSDSTVNTVGLLQFFDYSTVNAVHDSTIRRYCKFISREKHYSTIKTKLLTAGVVVPNGHVVSTCTITLRLRAALFYECSKWNWIPDI